MLGPKIWHESLILNVQVSAKPKHLTKSWKRGWKSVKTVENPMKILNIKSDYCLHYGQSYSILLTFCSSVQNTEV